MHRTQLYLDDDLWNALRTQARKQGTSISELVREAARARYLGRLTKRREAMQAIIGMRKDVSESVDSTEYVRRLRRGKRLERLRK
jgi:Ribbon-helix-helix protein, copG family